MFVFNEIFIFLAFSGANTGSLETQIKVIYYWNFYLLNDIQLLNIFVTLHFYISFCFLSSSDIHMSNFFFPNFWRLKFEGFACVHPVSVLICWDFDRSIEYLDFQFAPKKWFKKCLSGYSESFLFKASFLRQLD